MQLNKISSAKGARKPKKRLGRGIGSGKGKTCGRGHKGQRARSGGFKVGFEGGQMPIQRRLPKFGFTSMKSAITDEIRLNELNKVDADIINIDALRKAGLITANIKRVKVMLSGKLEKAVKLSGIRVTRGARAAIETAGGKVED